MPIYEYKCINCGHILEELQSMSEPPLTKCPNCGEETLKRLIGAGSGIIFKGTGFYLTDYKNKTSSHVDTAAKNSEQTEKKSTDKKQDSSKKDSSTSNKKD